MTDPAVMRRRSVLICHRGATIDTDGLSRWLASFSDLAGVVILEEPPARTIQRIRAQVKRTGVVRLLDVFAFRVWYRLRHAAADRRFEHDAVDALKMRFGDPPAAPVLRTRSVNSPEAIAFLRECQPDFVIARCKTLLKPAVFQIPTRGTYVLHPGICPEYRNAHGCFWALAERDVDRVGLTLLRIDEGVDTGPIYGYFTTSSTNAARATCGFSNACSSRISMRSGIGSSQRLPAERLPSTRAGARAPRGDNRG